MDDLIYIQNNNSEELRIIEHGGIKYHNIIFEDREFEVSAKIKITLAISSSGELKKFWITKVSGDKKDGTVNFSTFSLEKLASFVQFLVDNISSLKEGKIALSEIEGKEINVSKNQIQNFLETKQGQDIIKEILSNKTTKEDIVNIGYRKEQLNIFNNLLLNIGSLEEYKNSEIKNNLDLCKTYGLTEKSKNEKIWQYFFEKNNWIFGYGLDYRFMGIIQRESDLSTKTVGGKESVNGDFLVGDNNYVHFVELKLPNTPLFGKHKNRSNSWSLSDDLFEAKSQILEQKASGLIKLNQKHSEEDRNYKKISGKAYDSKVILIVGDIDGELRNSSDEEGIKEIKRKTFELFRRDSRNLEIITYRELYDRANFIVNK